MVMVTALRQKRPAAMGFTDILCRSAPALFRPRGNTITPPILTEHIRTLRIEAIIMAPSIMVPTDMVRVITVMEFIS